MIRYSLVCPKQHDFEAWFANAADYDAQRKRKLVTCPFCGSEKIEKALMAPRLGSGTKKREIATEELRPNTPTLNAPVAPPQPVMMSPQEAELRTKLREFREHLTKDSTNVGAKFSEEARKMHYGETEHRSIHGQASMEDAKEMLEEGITFHPLPVLPEDRN